MKRGMKRGAAKAEAEVNDLEQEIEELEFAREMTENQLVEKREQLFLLRTLLGICPWCGGNDCSEAAGSCVEGLD